MTKPKPKPPLKPQYTAAQAAQRLQLTEAQFAEWWQSGRSGEMPQPDAAGRFDAGEIDEYADPVAPVTVPALVATVPEVTLSVPFGLHALQIPMAEHSLPNIYIRRRIQLRLTGEQQRRLRLFVSGLSASGSTVTTAGRSEPVRTAQGAINWLLDNLVLPVA